MNYKKLAYGFLVILIFVAIFMFVGCNGDDCGLNCDLGACGLSCNGHLGCVGMAVMDGCTPVGIGICDDCGSCIGCGIEDGDLWLHTSDEREQYMVGETAIIHANVVGYGGFSRGVFDEAVFLEIIEDTTGDAKLDRTKSGIKLTSSSVGSVTIEAKLGNYADTITIEFVTIESIQDQLSISLDDMWDMYTDYSYELRVIPSLHYVSVDSGHVTYSLSNNTANATLNGNTISASDSGSVTVTAKFTWEGKTFTATKTYTFAQASLRLNITDVLCIGNKVELSCSVLSGNSSYNDSQYTKYTIISGDARLIEENGSFYIIANSAGDVTVKAEYNNNGTQMVAEETLTFLGSAITIYTDSALYVGEEVKLSATCPIDGFDENQVQYFVVSGSATINGNVLKVTNAETIVIYATAMCNGTKLTSDEFSLKFSFGANTIASASQLGNLNNSSEEFFLINDIDLSSVVSWTSIENFSGTLHGNNHTILGLKIDVNNLESNKGLFAVLGGAVENLTINGTITCNGEASRLGLLCGENKGTITNVKVSGSISAPYCDYVGGIAGYSDTSKITNCIAQVNITAREYTGGIAGYISADRSSVVIFENNTNNGEINGTSYVGGMAGFYKVKGGKNNDPITISNCINNSSVNGSQNNVGGLFGQVEGDRYETTWDGNFHAKMKITLCENNADISGQDYVGGLFGTAPVYVDEVVLSTNTGNITGNMYVGGFAGSAQDTVFKGLKNTNVITGKAYIGGIAGYAGTLDSCENSGEIIAVRYYLDNNNMPLSYVGGIVGYANSIVNCTNNSSLNISDGGYYVGGIVGYLAATRSESVIISGNTNNGTINGTHYVGGIAGRIKVLEGKNNDFITISNNKNRASIVSTENYVGGLFGDLCGDRHETTWDGTFCARIKVTDCYNEATVSGKDYVGGIVGSATEYVSEIILCHSLDDVTGNLYVGGFAGYAKDTLMINLKNSVTVTGKAYVGGIAGYAGKLEKCENNGTIIALSYYLDNNNVALSYVGGLSGYATGAKSCTNNSDIDVSEGGNYVGGIVGYVSAPRSASIEFKGNVNNGAIKGTNYVGGMAGAFAVSDGKNNDVIVVAENKNYASITSSGNYVGGLFGELKGNRYDTTWDGTFRSNIRVVSNQNEANVTGVDYVGGIAGNCHSYVLVEAVVWNTNSNEGIVTATSGSNKGDFYGAIA